MNLNKINSRIEYDKIVCDNNKNKLILYNSVPCKACIEVKNKLVNLSNNIDNWEFYEIDIRIIFDICKKKNIDRLPVLEFYKYNSNPYMMRCVPFIEKDILQNLN